MDDHAGDTITDDGGQPDDDPTLTIFEPPERDSLNYYPALDRDDIDENAPALAQALDASTVGEFTRLHGDASKLTWEFLLARLGYEERNTLAFEVDGRAFEASLTD